MYTATAEAYRTERQGVSTGNNGTKMREYEHMLPPSNMRLPASPSRRHQSIVKPPPMATKAKK